MKLSDLKSIDQIIAERQASDPEFAEEWDRTAFARQVAITIARYRADRGMTQRDLAEATGLKQPAIARLELGEGVPSLATLAKLSRATGLEFQVDVAQGEVELRPASPKVAIRFEMPFLVRHGTGEKLSKADLAKQVHLLERELRKLEKCSNDDLRDASVVYDVKPSVITMTMTVIADVDAEALKAARGVCRTAIHAAGGATPDWDKTEGEASTADFKARGYKLEYV